MVFYDGFPVLSEDQDFFLLNSSKLSCGLKQVTAIDRWPLRQV